MLRSESELTTARDTPRSAKDCVDIQTPWAANWPLRFVEATANPNRFCGTQASCLAADGVDRALNLAASFSGDRARAPPAAVVRRSATTARTHAAGERSSAFRC